MDMDNSENFTLAGNTMDFITMDQYLDLSNLSTSFGQDVDDRLVSLVDSPQASPLSNEPTSPSIPDVDTPVQNVLSIPDSESLHFDFDLVDYDATMYKLEKEILGHDKPEVDLETSGQSSLEAWLCDPKSTNFIENFNSEQANALLVEAASAADILAKEPVSSTMSDDTNTETYSSNIIDDDELISLSVRDLNRKLSNCPKEIQQDLKRRRRTLKNRGYAQNCRTKRIKDKAELERDNDHLLKQLQIAKTKLSDMNKVKRENDTLQAEVRLLRNEVTQLRVNQRSWGSSSSVSSPESQW